jgi:CHASE3 domain sensor protein
MIIGTRMTGDTLEKKVKKMVNDSPTAQRLLKIMEKSDKLFGDDQAIAQITGFFKEARALVSSPEAKNFFTNVTELMKQLGEKTDEQVEIELPTLPGAADDKGDE